MKEIRVRIAPSPTGFAHVGTAYTALINYAFARHNAGKFIVRIEDSDLKRNIEGAEEKIYQALDWLGIDWDEGTTKDGSFGPYKLSERLDLYKKKADLLLKNGFAYEDDGAIRFKNPGEDVSWNDAVRGEISFPGDQITDFVIIKSDGYPTYNFNAVVDDIEMKISHVIRGEDHVSNTPRQIALYKAFGAELPVFAHHAMLLNNQKKKLSKRDAAVDIMAYRQMGYLPEAFINFLSLLGWSHPEAKEIFSLEEFVDKFSLERLRPSGAVFNVDKLDWINGEYIKEINEDKLKQAISNFYDQKYDLELIEKIIPLVRERISTLAQFSSIAGFFFIEPDLSQVEFSEEDKKHLATAKKVFETLDNWELEKINQKLMAEIDNNGYKVGKFFMSLRLAITGKKVTPPINDSIAILGKEETLKRLNSIV